MGMRFSEHSTFAGLDNLTGSAGQPFRQDIGGTNAQTNYVTMKNYGRAVFFVLLGSWNGSDDLDEFRFQQATNSSGGSVKDLTTDASGGNYDTDNTLNAAGDFAIAEVRAEDMDVDGGFDFLRGFVGEGSDSGTDNIGGMLVRYDFMYPQKEIQGAAVTGEKVYVDPST